jgi:hypothetical protein
MKANLWWQIGPTILLCAIAVHGQDKPELWHGISIIPSPTPQCLVRKDPDQKTFLPCSEIALLSPNYLRHRDIAIWVPPHYKIRPAGYRFWLTQAGAALMGVADEEATQSWLHSPTCTAPGVTCLEENPVLGNTRLRAYSIIGGVTALSMYLSYKQRRYQIVREQNGLPQWRTIFYAWWLIDGALVADHIFGIAGSAWRLKQTPQPAS